MQVDSLLGSQRGVAFGGAFEGVEGGELRGFGGGFGFGREGGLPGGGPGADAGEAGLDLVGVGLKIGGEWIRRAGAEGCEGGAGVGLAETVFEAVLAVAVGAVDGLGLGCGDESLAAGFGALGCGLQGGFGGGCGFGIGGSGEIGFAPVGGPFSGVRTLVGGFGAVVEAVGLMAGVAAEGEEVELVAVREVAVVADGFKVGGVHCRVGCV